MKQDRKPRVFSPEQQQLWAAVAPSIWTLENGVGVEDPAISVMRTLWDQPRWLEAYHLYDDRKFARREPIRDHRSGDTLPPRWLEAYHLYDDRGSALFEQICDLPEYYLTRTENHILEEQSESIIAAAPVDCIIELGAGSAKKTTHLLKAQQARRGGGIFAPIDVSLPGLIHSRDFVRANFPGMEFHGLHARYEEGFSNINRQLPILYVFLGSTVGNFNPSSFVRFFGELSAAMGPDDFLLLGIDRLKDVSVQIGRASCRERV